MKVLRTIQEVRAFVRTARGQGQSIGLVPTMGALHQGHMALVDQANSDCHRVIVSIFVNPTQFGPQEDLSAYPRPFEQDIALCRQHDVAAVFAPDAAEMYGQESLTWVVVERLTESLCGRSRPGHFRGVTTVCAKLFNIVVPDKAFFGQKDAQQSLVIQQMVQDLNMPLEIVICPTVREADGLAVSSRNQYLSVSDRQKAPVLHQVLQTCQEQIFGGQRCVPVLIQAMTDALQGLEGAAIDYVSIVDAQTLEPVQMVEKRVLVALAVKLGAARLIDNIVVDVES